MLRGRGTQLDAIRGLVAGARAGRGGALVVCGEAGMGKSALLTEAAKDVAELTVLTCTGVESEVALAFSGLQQLLAPIMSGLEALPADQASAVLGTHGVVAEPTTDYLVSAGTLTLLTCAAAGRPVLVVVDDAQYLDRASIGALTFAARRVSNAAVALLFGVRSVDRHVLDRAAPLR